MTTKDGNEAIRAVKMLEALAERGYVRLERRRPTQFSQDVLWYVSVSPPIEGHSIFVGPDVITVMHMVQEVTP